MQLYETNSEFGISKVGGEVKAFKKFISQYDYTPWMKPKSSPH